MIFLSTFTFEIRIAVCVFVGGSRHVPGSQSSMTQAPPSGTDPFTGGGRYIPGGPPPQPSSSGSDPFTGKDCSGCLLFFITWKPVD